MGTISYRFILSQLTTIWSPVLLPDQWLACTPISCSYFRMTAFGDWGCSGRTLHNQKTLICQGCNIFFLEPFQECFTGGGGDGPWNREY